MAQHSEFIERWLEGFDGHQFYSRTYPATFPKAVVVFVHGFAEHIGRYEHVHTKYPMHSITLFAYDQRGYGRTALDGAHRSKDASYGKTNWNLALQDIDFFVKHAAKEYPNTPLFLMGHSAGGALALAYFTRNAPPPSLEGPKLISGVICSSPFITLTNPTPKLLRWTGSKMASMAPYMTFPADVGAENLTRSQAQIDAYLKDPLIKRVGTLKMLEDMMNGGDRLLIEDWKRWPKTLPILFVHGTADKVTSCKSTEEFYNKLDATDKKLSLYEGCYHELVNEIDDVPHRLGEEIAHWVDTHLPSKLPRTGETEGALPQAADAKL